MIKTNNQNRGAALILAIIFILALSLTISSGLVYLALNTVASTQNKIKSIQSYYAAETGIEDSLLRLKKSMQFSSPNVLTLEESTVSIDISEAIGGSRTITSAGNTDNRIRKVSVTYIVKTDAVSFHYGAQAGLGGIVMGNNSRIEGNVFSNGSILPSGGGIADITDAATVAINGNKIDSLNIGGDAYAHSCKDSNITGTLYYVSGGGIENCTYGSLVNMGPNEIEAEELPISSEQIDKWKNEAAAGGTISGDYSLVDGSIDSLGPVKITGDMLIGNNSVLNITGTIYIQGNVILENNVLIQLDNSFSSLSGLIVSDGKITVRNNADIQGSGEEGSFMMLLSTNDSLDPANPAIDVSNNAEGAIFFASDGVIHLHNNINIREATGYKLALDNNAVISYETGLENVNFTSGPGGSWQVENWQEVE